MQANKEMNRILSTEKATMMFKCIVSQISVAALVVIVAMAGSAAANDNPRPIVTSTSPVNGAQDVSVNARVTVNFSMPMKCNSLNPNTFKLHAYKLIHIAAGSVTCSGNSATFTPLGALAINTLYKLKFVGSVKGFNGRALKTDFESFFTTGENFTTPTPTATATATASSTATATATATSTATSTATATSTPTPTATPTPFAPAVISTYPGIVGCGGQAAPSGQTFTVTFSEPMMVSSLQAAFFVSVPGGGPFSIQVPGTVTYDATNDIATFTPTGGVFPINTVVSIAVFGAESASGLTMPGEYDFSFMTGPGLDTTAPLVSSTNPPNAAITTPTNQSIVASFDKAIDATTLTAATFIVTGPLAVPVTGTVTYSTVGNTATFTPDTVLAITTPYTATITTGVTDLSGTALANNYSWTFTTGSTTDTTGPTVTSISPALNAPGVGIDTSINATFSKPMSPSSFNQVTFTLMGPFGPEIGNVSYDVPDQIVTFTPQEALSASTLYTATISPAPQDLSGNSVATNPSWSFTTGITATGQSALDLGAASNFAALAQTSVSSTGLTVLNGDLGVTPMGTVTGFAPGVVNGTIQLNNTPAADALSSLTTAYNSAAGLSGATLIPENLATQTLTPGLYQAALGADSFEITGGNLTLDAQGDAAAVWIFQMPLSTLTLTAPSCNVVLENGAQASNIFWQVGSSATIGAACTLEGNILADTSITVGTGATVNGRLLAGAIASSGAITLDGNMTTLPVCY